MAQNPLIMFSLMTSSSINSFFDNFITDITYLESVELLQFFPGLIKMIHYFQCNDVINIEFGDKKVLVLDLYSRLANIPK